MILVSDDSQGPGGGRYSPLWEQALSCAASRYSFALPRMASAMGPSWAGPENIRSSNILSTSATSMVTCVADGQARVLVQAAVTGPGAAIGRPMLIARELGSRTLVPLFRPPGRGARTWLLHHHGSRPAAARGAGVPGMDPGRGPGRVRRGPAPRMPRRQTGAPGPPPRQPAGAQGALVIQEPRVSAEAKSAGSSPPRRPRRRLARPAVPGAVGQRGPASAVARLCRRAGRQRLPRVGGRAMVRGGGLRRVDDVRGRRLVRGVGPRGVRARDGGAHGVQALGRPRTQCVRCCGLEVGQGVGLLVRDVGGARWCAGPPVSHVARTAGVRRRATRPQTGTRSSRCTSH